MTKEDIERAQFVTACRMILDSEKTNDYAKAYARAGLDEMVIYRQKARHVQALYILNNITHWRDQTGDAKAVRQVLKSL